MKIGILTFHRAYNYGAFLQCRALQEYLKSQGHDVEVIDYNPAYFRESYSVFPIGGFSSLSLFSKFKRLAGLLSLAAPRFLRYRVFEKDISSSLQLTTKKYFFLRDLDNIPFECIIFGSDQIWNTECTAGLDLVFWGGFNFAGYKIAYAASAGNNLRSFKEIFTDVETLLSKYNAISVREKHLSCFLSKELGRNIPVVIDPVFLLDCKQWAQWMANRYFKKKYVLLYQVTYSSQAENFAKKIAKERNISLKVISSGVTKHFETWRTAAYSPMEFVALFASAEFIVTTSFHGTAFSLIFNRPFLCFEAQDQYNGRVTSLLENLDIVEQYVTKNAIPIARDIDYLAVNKKLEKLCVLSKKFLVDVLRNKQTE